MRRFCTILPMLLLVSLSACTTPAALPTPASPAPAPILPSPPQREPNAPVTLLISIDGFRPDYLNKGYSTNLDTLAENGVSAAMRPSFPSKTFPNHYAIVTGLRPDRNGIIGNVMEDPRRPGVKFTLDDAKQALDPFWWDEAEPIWATAEKQGIRTATLFWPGSEVPIHETRPRNWQRFDRAITNVQRVEGVIDWLRRPSATRPQLITLYFDAVDSAGHEFGPGAPETMAAVKQVDDAIGTLISEMATLEQPANIVIVSDHGMAAVDQDRLIKLNKIVNMTHIRLITDGTYAGIVPLPGKTALIEKQLLKPHQHMACWRKADIPTRLHYGKNPRVPPILCLAQSGWRIVNDKPTWVAKGDHGYDNDGADMRALFIANGPAFISGATIATFDNVDVYPLIARLSGVTPLPGDGNAGTFNGVLKP